MKIKQRERRERPVKRVSARSTEVRREKEQSRMRDLREPSAQKRVYAGAGGPGTVYIKGLNREFDPGSGRTLAACLTHASRTEIFRSLLLDILVADGRVTREQPVLQRGTTAGNGR